MAIMAVIGGQWGDEGKGKIIDVLAKDATLVVRYQGGGNAGHRVVNERGDFKFRLVPSGILYPQTSCLIGNGMVVDPRALLAEIKDLSEQGVDCSRLYISDRAHVVMPYHFLLDQLNEEERGAEKLGTTGRGIGPAYVDKYSRVGIRMADLLDSDTLRSKLTFVLAQKNRILTSIYNQPPLEVASLHAEYLEFGQQLQSSIVDGVEWIQHKLNKQSLILLEGAQGALLDIDFGTYPFVTSSSTLAGNACSGAGIPVQQINRVLGVFKAYITRVGVGPMPTELQDATGAFMRERGYEFGTVTGRPRRCGWFDAVAGRYVARLNGLSGLVITKLDVLDSFETIKICTAYRLRDKLIQHVPGNLSHFAACEPVYEEMPGWQSETSNLTSYEDLPANARAYLNRLAELLETPLHLLSLGPNRNQTIQLEEGLTVAR